MNIIKPLVYSVLFSLCPLLNAIDENIVSAIRRSNVEELRKVFMTGDHISLTDKKAYAKIALQRTKEAHMNLKAAGLSDVKHSSVGILKALGALLTANACWTALTLQKNYGTQESEKNTTLLDIIKDDVAPGALKEPLNAFNLLMSAASKNWEACGFMGITCYLVGKTIEEASALIHKDERYDKFVRALAIESLVSHVPVLESKQ